MATDETDVQDVNAKLPEKEQRAVNTFFGPLLKGNGTAYKGWRRQLAIQVGKLLFKLPFFVDQMARFCRKAVFGVETLEEVMPRLQQIFGEAAGRGNAQQFIQNPDDFKRQLQEALKDPEMIQFLLPLVMSMQRAQAGEVKDKRFQAIRKRIAHRYQITDQDELGTMEKMVQLVYRTTRLGSRESTWDGIIDAAIDDLENKAQETIASLPTKGRKKFPADKMSNYSALVLSEGIDPQDVKSVQSFLSQRDELKPILKEPEAS